MPILHLGCIDIPYVKFVKGKAKRTKKGAAEGKTTGDVAEILEAKYHPMEIFYELHKGEISRALTNSLQGSLETLLGGGQMPSDPFAGAMGKVETAFKKFLSDREMDRIGYPGVPTQAALKGVNHRHLHPYASGNPQRPSFIDTGQYQASMKAWID